MAEQEPPTKMAKNTASNTTSDTSQPSNPRFERLFHQNREGQVQDGIRDLFVSFHTGDPSVSAVKTAVLDVVKTHYNQCQSLPITLLTPDIYRVASTQIEEGKNFRLRFINGSVREMIQSILLRHGHSAYFDAIGYPIHYTPNGLVLEHVYRAPGKKFFGNPELELKYHKRNFIRDLPLAQQKAVRESRFNTKYGTENRFIKDFGAVKRELPVEEYEPPNEENKKTDWPHVSAASTGIAAVTTAPSIASDLADHKGEDENEKTKEEAAAEAKKQEEKKKRKEERKKKKEEERKKENENLFQDAAFVRFVQTIASSSPSMPLNVVKKLFYLFKNEEEIGDSTFVRFMELTCTFAPDMPSKEVKVLFEHLKNLEKDE